MSKGLIIELYSSGRLYGNLKCKNWNLEQWKLESWHLISNKMVNNSVTKERKTRISKRMVQPYFNFQMLYVDRWKKKKDLIWLFLSINIVNSCCIVAFH